MRPRTRTRSLVRGRSGPFGKLVRSRWSWKRGAEKSRRRGFSVSLCSARGGTGAKRASAAQNLTTGIPARKAGAPLAARKPARSAGGRAKAARRTRCDAGHPAHGRDSYPPEPWSRPAPAHARAPRAGLGGRRPGAGFRAITSSSAGLTSVCPRRRRMFSGPLSQRPRYGQLAQPPAGGVSSGVTLVFTTSLFGLPGCLESPAWNWYDRGAQHLAQEAGTLPTSGARVPARHSGGRPHRHTSPSVARRPACLRRRTPADRDRRA